MKTTNLKHLTRSQLRHGDPNLHLFSAAAPAFDCYVFIPRRFADVSRVLVCVHGVSRNALEQIELLRPYAEKYGFAVIAPLFTQKVFRDYQRLGRRHLGPRADLALIRALQTIGSTTCLNTSKVAMFGFSGGGQFVHRFAFAHSPRVSSMVIGAAGWYTLPDPQQSYPYGTANANGLDAVRLNPRATTRLPTMVVVGSSDNLDDDPELNRSEKVLRMQGPNRLERAEKWVDAMKAYAANQGSVANMHLQVLPGIGHSFSDAVSLGGLGGLMFEFLDRHAGAGDARKNLRVVRNAHR